MLIYKCHFYKIPVIFIYPIDHDVIHSFSLQKVRVFSFESPFCNTLQTPLFIFRTYFAFRYSKQLKVLYKPTQPTLSIKCL